MKIVIDTFSTNPEFNGDCDYAAVDVTPELLAQLQRRAALARQMRAQDDRLYELYFWDSPAYFYDATSLDDVLVSNKELGESLTNEGYAPLPRHVQLDPHGDEEPQPQRTECNQTIVRICSDEARTIEIAWTTIPKHSDVYVTTRDIPLETLEALVAAPSKEPAA